MSRWESVYKLTDDPRHSETFDPCVTLAVRWGSGALQLIVLSIKRPVD